MLRIFSAGVCGKIAKETLERYKKENPDMECELIMGGSTGGINKLLSGEKFDLMLLADDSNIKQLMMPEYCSGYYIWGGNEMVVVGNDVNDDNWAEKLTSDEATLKHMNPYDDPSGYRAVMAIKLADRVEDGLSERIFSNPNYKGLDRKQYERNRKPDNKKPDHKAFAPMCEDNVYQISYRSSAVGNNFNYALLPKVMNLGDENFEEEYNKVSFVVDGGNEIFGTTIFHAAVTPDNAQNKEAAEEFLKEFLNTDFVKYGFTDVRKSVGNWNLL